MSEINQDPFRNKVTLVSFLLCVGVVYQHTQWLYHQSAVLNEVYRFFFFVIESCVPFFFILSGFLFFRTFESDKWKKKITSRVHSLLVPYLIWNLFYILFTVTMSRLGFMKSPVQLDSIGHLLVAWINSETSPLWFVRYLFLFVLLSPALFFILRRRLLGSIFVCGLIAFNA